MTQTIKIKRSTGSAAPSTLAQGELAYSKGSGFFYVGDPATANTPIQINGAIVNNSGTPVLGTGITAAEIRTLIGVDASGTDNSTDVTLNAAITDVFSISGQEISAVDGTADRLVFWDDSASKLTYMTPSALKDFASLNTTDDVTFNDLTVTGNLTITGDIDSYNVTDLDVTDKTITVNVGGTEAGSDGSGLKVYRGTTETAASILWDETDGKFNFSDGIQVATQTVISDVGRFYASDGTDVKAAYSFDSSSTTGLSYETSRDRIKFLSGGAVRAYIQTPSSNPIAPAMYIDGRTEVNGRIYATGDGNSGNWKDAYDWGDHGDAGYLTDVAFSDIQSGSVLLSTETFSDSDSQLMSAKAINDRIESFGYGTISSIEVDSTDGSISGTGIGTTGAITFDLEVATIDGGTY